VYLSRHVGDGFLSVQTIAAAQEIPPKFLEQILLTLKRAKIVFSAKGHRGGFRLAREPGEITLAEIIRLFDGALAPTESVSLYFYRSTPVEREKKLMAEFKALRDMVARRLEKRTIADVM
jgi:Rrf2 family transcriptional regulator, cysteine metabolism repressor